MLKMEEVMRRFIGVLAILALAQSLGAQAAQLVNSIELYRALGGNWVQTPASVVR